jgi:hypothetical protein
MNHFKHIGRKCRNVTSPDTLSGEHLISNGIWIAALINRQADEPMPSLPATNQEFPIRTPLSAWQRRRAETVAKLRDSFLSQ